MADLISSVRLERTGNPSGRRFLCYTYANVTRLEMRGPSLDIDATIDDLVESLDDPEDYVRRALDNLHAEVRKEPNSRLTIGITSYGVYPNYKIDIPVELEKLDMQYIARPKVFSGRTHQELADPLSVRDEHWSAASTSLIELQALLRNLRKRKKPSGQARPIAE